MFILMASKEHILTDSFECQWMQREIFCGWGCYGEEGTRKEPCPRVIVVNKKGKASIREKSAHKDEYMTNTVHIIWIKYIMHICSILS